MNLPTDLRLALEATLSPTPTKNVARTVDKLSQRYRTGHALSTSQQQTFLQSEGDIIAYIAYRLPATFAAISAALIQLRANRPGWYPRSVLDVGAGPGTATWAAVHVWPEIEHMTLIEQNQHMMDYGKKLASHAHAPAIKQAEWQQRDVTEIWTCAPHDLVIGAYMLGELPLSLHTTLIDKLWSCSTDTLLLVEPGTPRGFSLIRAARAQLLAQRAFMLAPCPHNNACPVPENDWCHFSQRIARTRLQRAVKGAELSYEDEKFSYCALSKQSGLPIAGRVLRHPQKRSGHIHMELCTPRGLQQITVTRSQRAAYREAHDIQWGDTISQSIEDSLSTDEDR